MSLLENASASIIIEFLKHIILEANVVIFNKLCHHMLIIVAFVYFVMCPSVHELGDNIRYDVVYKAGTKTIQKEFKNDSSTTPFHVSNNDQKDIFVQTQDAQKLFFFLPPHPTLNLTILSTVRLIL